MINRMAIPLVLIGLVAGCAERPVPAPDAGAVLIEEETALRTEVVPVLLYKAVDRLSRGSEADFLVSFTARGVRDVRIQQCWVARPNGEFTEVDLTNAHYRIENLNALDIAGIYRIHCGQYEVNKALERWGRRGRWGSI